MTTNLTAYQNFTRDEWESYRQDEPLVLNEADLERLHGVNEVVSMSEIEDIYLPLSRLINLYVTETQSLYRITRDFLSASALKVPYIIGVSGSVAVGKSTVSRVLQALLSRWKNHPKVALVTTDGFLYSNAELEEQGLMQRKGFPESFDQERILRFLSDLKSGVPVVHAPIYSHQIYDIVQDEHIALSSPDIVIIEGLNLLQTGVVRPGKQPNLFVSDFLDFTVFVDAEIESIKQWYIERVLYFCGTSFQKSDNYFHFLSQMNQEEQVKFGERVWHEINELNLVENILPFRERARLILHKAQDHSVDRIELRKL
jgi:type I pantothenate kinase